ncbi:MAG: hypothetical protein L6Q51_10115 [Cyclobacteriaceae bacterium]|nr:hypothetical protein [Cyclobacteriaceae bacterium]
MSRKGLLLNLLLVCIWLSCDTGGNIEPLFKEHFIKYYGEDGDQEGRDLIVNPDGTILILGSTQLSAQRRQIFVVKADAVGNIIWQKRMGASFEDPRDIELVATGPFAGNFVILTNTRKPVGDSTLVKLIIVDQNGNKQDSVEYNAWQSQYGYSVTTTSDGHFIITGNTSPEAFNDGPMAVADLSDLLSIRFDGNLNLTTWPTDFGGEGDIMGIKYFEISPAEHYFAAYTDKLLSGELNISSSYDYNFWFNKVKDNVRTDFFEGGAATAERMSWITSSPSGTYLAIGTTTNTSGDQSILLTKVINGFTLTESKSFSSGFQGVHACSYGVNRYLIVGNQIRPGNTRNIWLAKVNPALDIEFQTFFGGESTDDRATAVAELPNGDILVLGTMNLTNQDKIALIKLNPQGSFE